MVVSPGSEPGGRWFDSNPRSLLKYVSGVTVARLIPNQLGQGSNPWGRADTKRIVLWPSGNGNSLTKSRSGVRVPPGLLCWGHWRHHAAVCPSPSSEHSSSRLRNATYVVISTFHPWKVVVAIFVEPCPWCSCNNTKTRVIAHQEVLVEQRNARLPVTQEVAGSNPVGNAFHYGALRQQGRATWLKPRWMGVRIPRVLLKRIWVVLLAAVCKADVVKKRGGDERFDSFMAHSKRKECLCRS